MPAHDSIFRDRTDAGRQLAAALKDMPGPDLVLALPRGGVPVAFEIARAFAVPLDLLMVRKIPAPGHEEYGIGAVVDGASPQIVLNDAGAALPGVTQTYVDQQVAEKLKEIEHRRLRYVGTEAPAPVRGKSVVLADDGIATGGTALAGLKALREAGARKVTLAVPVAPREAISRMNIEADAVVCLQTPADFRAVGQFYADFNQTPDEAVVALLEHARALLRAGR